MAKSTAYLVARSGPSPGTEFALSKARNTIGRAANNTLVFAQGEISKRHAEIVCEGGGYVVRDLGSSNGTFVNSTRVQSTKLANGDTVAFGTVRFSFVLKEPMPAVDEDTDVVVGRLNDDDPLFHHTARFEIVQSAAQITRMAELREKYDRVRTAFEAVQQLLMTADLSVMCRRILQVTFKLVKAEEGTVLLLNPEGELETWAHKSIQPGEPEPETLSRTVLDRVLANREGVLATDVEADHQLSESASIIVSGARSLMAVPLISGDSIHGVLYVSNSSQVAALTPSDLELLSGIGAGAGMAVANALMAQKMAADARTRDSLGRFLSPVLVDQVINNNLDLMRGGDARDVTVLFSDIRGFTQLTENVGGAQVVELLNEYFDPLVDVVFEHKGVLDKFVGDAIMAVWGTPVSRKDDAVQALAAAREMMERLGVVNEQRSERGAGPIRHGIGLASGRCVAGNIGGGRRMEYTVIGDAVNLASRLSGVARGGEILIDEATYLRAGKPAGAQELPPTEVKGKSQPVRVFSLVLEDL
jgi:adenylate cyclase